MGWKGWKVKGFWVLILGQTDNGFHRLGWIDVRKSASIPWTPELWGGLRRFPKALSLTKPKLYQRAWTYTSLATAQPSCWNGWVWASFQLSHHCDHLKIKYVLAFFTLFNHIRCLRLQRKSSWNMLKPSANTLLPQANHPFLHMVPSSLGLGSSFALALGCSLMKAGMKIPRLMYGRGSKPVQNVWVGMLTYWYQKFAMFRFVLRFWQVQIII